MAKETTERGEKSALHEVSMHFYQKRREKEKSKRKQKKTMDIDIQHESSHNPRNWNIFTFTPFDYLKKKDFSIAYYRLRRTPHQLWRIFSCQ